MIGIINEKTELEICNYYINNKISLYKIGKLYNCSSTPIIRILKKYNIPTRKYGEVARIHNFNQKYFEIIDSHSKSRDLGFIGADGCVHNAGKVTGSYYLTIGLHIQDYDYLNKLRLRWDYPVAPKIDCKNKNHCNLSIASKQFFLDLNDKGIHMRKSLTHEFPDFNKVPEKFINSWIAGYYEGDGSIYFRNNKKNPHRHSLDATVSICASKIFSEKFKEYISKVLNINVKLIYSKKSIWYIKISGSYNVEKFLDWIYKDLPTEELMQRKYERYLLLKKDRKRARLKIEDQEKRKAEKAYKKTLPKDWIKLSEVMKIVRATNSNYDSQKKHAILKNIKTNEIINIKGVRKFVKENPNYNFCWTGVAKLINGKIKRYKDWILVEKLN